MADKINLEFGNASDVGQVRQANEDYFGYYKGQFGELFIVCDGMGGYKGGKIASTAAVETIKKHFENLQIPKDIRLELYNSLKEADREIVAKAEEDMELGRMGSTAVVVLINELNLFFAHIGDSRIYRVRDDEIEQLTKDHSLVQEMVDSKIITPEQAEHHPQKNVILRSLGPNGNSEPFVDPRDEVLFQNDYIILCSDGLTGHVSDNEIKDIVLKNAPRDACLKLVALANERGGKDNITLQVIKIVEGKKRATSLKDTARLWQAAIMAFAALIILILWFILNSPNTKVDVNTNSSDSSKNQSGDTSGVGNPIGGSIDNQTDDTKNPTDGKKGNIPQNQNAEPIGNTPAPTGDKNKAGTTKPPTEIKDVKPPKSTEKPISKENTPIE